MTRPRAGPIGDLAEVPARQRRPAASAGTADAPAAAPALRRRGLAQTGLAGCFAAGLALSLLMLVRGQVGGDQLNLLARGWLLATRGRWIWFGNPLSTGGKAPGGTTSLIAGLPLLLWRDHRAATAVVLLCHLAAYVLLDRVLARILSPRERLLFAVCYWLNPWRLYFSGFLWNPNYLYLAGALHLATAWAQRREARFGASFLHAAGLLLALQLHPSSLLLGVASALLLWRGYFRLHAAGTAVGLAAAALPLAPWLGEIAAHPALLGEMHKGFPLRGLLLGFPLLRGVLYWLRYASLSSAGRMTELDFREAFGAAGERLLAPLAFVLTQVVAPLTVVPSLLANVWLVRRALGRRGPWRRRLARLLRRLPSGASGRTWLRGYVALCLLATVLVLAASPTTFMYWQGLVLVHVAALPLVLWLGALTRAWRSPRARRRRAARLAAAAIAVYAALEIGLALGMAFGAPDYRCRGLDTVVFPLRYDSPMLHELGVHATCPWPVGDPQGWWPDVLPRPGER